MLTRWAAFPCDVEGAFNRESSLEQAAVPDSTGTYVAFTSCSPFMYIQLLVPSRAEDNAVGNSVLPEQSC